MKILAIGDPHAQLEKIKAMPLKGVDLILITGDLGKADLARQRFFENIEREKKGLPELEYTPEFNKKCFMEIYNSAMHVLRYVAKFGPTYFIFGNAEPTIPSTKKQMKELGKKLPLFPDEARKVPNVKIINNRVVNFKGVRIGGLEFFVDTNWVQEFKPNDYKKRMREAKKETEKARKILKRFKQVDILLHHQPPYGVLDKVGGHAPKHWHGKHAGSQAIRTYIKKYQPKYAFCGHIHEAEGKAKIGKTEVYNLGVAGYKIIEIK